MRQAFFENVAKFKYFGKTLTKKKTVCERKFREIQIGTKPAIIGAQIPAFQFATKEIPRLQYTEL